MPRRCCCTLCTHRQYSLSLETGWSDSIQRGNARTRTIGDMQIRGGVLYLVGWTPHPTFPGDILAVAQAWSLDGEKLWSTNLPNDFSPRRIDSDGSSVWIVGFSHASPPVFPLPDERTMLVALNAADGAALWETTILPDGGYDVEPDGTGGVFVGTQDGVQRYNASGAGIGGWLIESCSFIPPSGAVRSLLLMDGKLWAGVACADIVGADQTGHLVRIDLSGSGTVDLVAGCDLRTFSGAWPNRLVDAGGRLFAGYDWNPGSTADRPCSIVEWNPETGAFVNAFNVRKSGDEQPRRVIGLATDGAILAIAAHPGSVVPGGRGVLLLTDLSGAPAGGVRHTGEYGGSELEGTFWGVAMTADAIYAGGDSVGCKPIEDDATAEAAGCEMPECGDGACDKTCGDAGNGGGTVVGCACEEVPDNFATPGAGAGCLACVASSTISWTKTGPMEWTGTAPWCCGSSEGVMTIVATYSCESESWSAVVTVTVGASTFTRTANILRQWCASGAPAGHGAHPFFAGWVDVTAEDIEDYPEIFACCEEGDGGCFGTGDACATCCPESPVPSSLLFELFNIDDCPGLDDFEPVTLSLVNGTGSVSGSLLCGDWSFQLRCRGTEAAGVGVLEFRLVFCGIDFGWNAFASLNFAFLRCGPPFEAGAAFTVLSSPYGECGCCADQSGGTAGWRVGLLLTQAA